MNIKIIDVDGEWLKCKGSYGLTDPTTGNTFPFMQPVQVKRTEWLNLQIAAGVFESCPQTLGKPKEEEKATKVEKPKVETK
jgi:hypothetical protein